MADTDISADVKPDPDYKVPPPAPVSKTPDAPPSPGLDIGGALDRATSAVGSAARSMVREKNSIAGETERRMEDDRTIATEHLRAQGILADKLQPWNAQQEQEKFYHNPVQAFGSFASVFGIIASAFTHAPVENALNASAAAMTAIKENDDQGYNRAHSAWKENMDLTIKRAGLEQTAYRDAMDLMKTDQAAGEIKMRHAAERFGDKQMQAMLDNGLYQPIIDTMNARMKLVEGFGKLEDAMQERNIHNAFFNELEKDNPEHDPQKAMLNLNMSQGMKEPWQQVLMKREMIKSHGDTNHMFEFAAKLRDVNSNLSTLSAEERHIVDTRAKFLMSPEGGGVEESAALLQAYGDFEEQKKRGSAAGGNPLLTNDRRIMADLATERKKWEAEGKTPAEIAKLSDEFVKTHKQESTPVTSNRRDDLASLITRGRVAENTIDDIEKLLVQHHALTGLGGKITRPFEVVGNWFGSNETARKQFESYINELKLLGPRLLNEAKSRPLSAEEHQIASIVPGLSMGDTTQHTAQQLKQLQQLFRVLRADWTNRYKGSFDPDAPLPTGRKPTGKSLWQQAPLE